MTLCRACLHLCKFKEKCSIFGVITFGGCFCTRYVQWLCAELVCIYVSSKRNAAIFCNNFGWMFLYQVCATRGRTSEAGRRQRRATEETSFFSHETEFALADVLNTIPNDPPEITNPVGIFTMDEDKGRSKMHPVPISQKISIAILQRTQSLAKWK